MLQKKSAKIENHESGNNTEIKPAKFFVDFDIVFKVIPLFVTLLILYGIIEAKGFYTAFGISITDYLGFAESCTLFLDQIEIIAIGIICLLIIVIGASMYMNEIGHDVPKIVIPLNPYSKKVKILFRLILGVCIATILVNYIFFTKVLFLWIPIAVLSVMGYIFYQHSDQNKYLKRIFGYAIISLIPVMFSYVIYDMGVNRAKRTINNLEGEKGSHGMLIIYKDTIKNRSNNGRDYLYLGKTSSFYFLYSIKDTLSFVVPSEQVAELRFKGTSSNLIFQ